MLHSTPFGQTSRRLDFCTQTKPFLKRNPFKEQKLVRNIQGYILL